MTLEAMKQKLQAIESLVEAAEEQRRQEAERKEAQRQIEAARKRLLIALGMSIDVEV